MDLEHIRNFDHLIWNEGTHVHCILAFEKCELSGPDCHYWFFSTGIRTD